MPSSLSDKHQTHPRKTITVACSRLKTILNYSTLVEKFTVQISIILYSRGKVWTREKREQLKITFTPWCKILCTVHTDTKKIERDWDLVGWVQFNPLRDRSKDFLFPSNSIIYLVSSYVSKDGYIKIQLIF